MRRALVMVTLVTGGFLALPSSRAAAEDVDTTDVLAQQVEIFADQITRKLDMVSFGDYQPGGFWGVAGQTGFDYEADMQVDIRRRRARIRLGGGDDQLLAIRLDARIQLERGMPRIKGTLDLGVAGRRVRITLPDVMLQPTSYQGDLYLQVNIPLIEGRF